MDETAVSSFITSNFADVQVQTQWEYVFFFYGTERMMPFATIASHNNSHEHVSRLDRPGVFRLNLGVSKETYRSLFGPQPKGLGGHGVAETGHDFTALDTLMPHPHYAPQSWICVLNPSEQTFQKLRPLLTEAYEIAVNRSRRKTSTEPDA